MLQVWLDIFHVSVYGLSFFKGLGFRMFLKPEDFYALLKLGFRVWDLGFMV